jgi:hypothetical protein
MRKLNMAYIPIYLSARAHYFKSFEHDFSIELSLNLHLPIPEMRMWILTQRDCFGLEGVCFTSFTIKFHFSSLQRLVDNTYLKDFLKKQG